MSKAKRGSNGHQVFGGDRYSSKFSSPPGHIQKIYTYVFFLLIFRVVAYKQYPLIDVARKLLIPWWSTRKENVTHVSLIFLVLEVVIHQTVEVQNEQVV